MKVCVVDMKNIDSNLYRKLYRLNFRDNGLLQRRLVEAKNGNLSSAKVFYIAHEETVLSYSLAFKFRPADDWMGYFYTRAKVRRQGFGKTIFKKMRKRLGEFSFVPSGRNQDFFNKCTSENVVRAMALGRLDSDRY